MREGENMTISERQERILELLRQEPKISVAQMSAILYVSEPTVRRDLTELDAKGLIHKVYGGAVLPEGAETLIPFVFRENEKSAAKKLPKNTAVLGAKTACKNRAKLCVSVAMANISML